MSEDHHQRVEQTAAAIEDLVQMGIIKLEDKRDDTATLSAKFTQIAANVVSEMKLEPSAPKDQIMRMLYYSLLIYMAEHLHVPRSFMMALGNDMENNRQTMESGELVTNYVSVLAELWERNTRNTFA